VVIKTGRTGRPLLHRREQPDELRETAF